MGLDTYIFKTTAKEVFEKIDKIIEAQYKNRNEHRLFEADGLLYLRSDGMDHILELQPDIYWRKLNHATAWFSEKVFHNPKGTLEGNLGILEIEDLKRFRKDCKKVLDRCEMADGSIKIDKKFCKSIFPDLSTIPFAGNHEYDEEFIYDIKTALSDVDKLLLMSYNSNVEFIFFADY